ncbi:hypothetical protein chiPu_0006542 [Chiloscyllium punctatum]|uniref:Uncharacterized protein n=1 Tax=Chiloscyllium punctatum TaxID=137246 RepID=A0A401SCH9_CHIPU|nr:hypothetical protein [Chiloscyllium punctatum]
MPPTATRRRYVLCASRGGERERVLRLMTSVALWPCFHDGRLRRLEAPGSAECGDREGRPVPSPPHTKTHTSPPTPTIERARSGSCGNHRALVLFARLFF